MSALAEIGPKTTDLVVFFEIEWSDGSVFAPRVQSPYEASARPRRVSRTRFEVPPGALSRQAWRQFRLEISPFVERARDGFFDSGGFDRGGSRAVEAIRARIESFPFPEDAQIYQIPDYFKSVLFGLTLNRSRVRPEDPAAVRLIISLPNQRPMMIDAFSTDEQLKDLSVLLNGQVPDSVFLTESLGEWFRARRDFFRDSDPRWGRLSPALMALVSAGHPCVRLVSSPESTSSQRLTEVATRPDPGEDDFEPAVLTVGPDSLAQWRRAGLDYPQELIAEAERQAFSMLQHNVWRSIEAPSESGSPEQLRAEITSLREEIRDLQNKKQELQSEHDALVDARYRGALARYSNVLQDKSRFQSTEVRQAVSKEMLSIARRLYSARVGVLGSRDSVIHEALERYFQQPTGSHLRELMLVVRESRDDHAVQVANMIRSLLREASVSSRNLVGMEPPGSPE